MDRWLLWVAGGGGGVVFFWNVSGERDWAVESYNFQTSAAEIPTV